ncbi:hypothetical protein PCA31118_05367 [Pandoraea captiosa]|uniref:Uncharacterized protein n=1 Tax=Pandoraea captiosa TaxID=2508302 RepID=A0A5E5AT85_9BURK|nr:hypothetical protein PCA31118_05367 [Pandoraea captiosa]
MAAERVGGVIRRRREGFMQSHNHAVVTKSTQKALLDQCQMRCKRVPKRAPRYKFAAK